MMTQTPTMLERAQTLAPLLVSLRRTLHRHPELGFEEFTASSLICEILDGLQIRYRAGLGGTGVIAEIGEGRPAVALRADMDALPIRERTGLPFASEVAGVMHACGHDAHTAALLGAAMLLKASPLPAGSVRLLFQPAEETSDESGKSGAQHLIEAGAMEGIDAVFGLHNIVDQPVGVILVSPGPVLAATDTFHIVVHGRASHGAYPHRGVDAIVLAAQIINAIQTIVARQIDPMEAGVITIGTIAGGRKANIIADRVELTGTLRSFSVEVRQRLHTSLEHACQLARLLGGDFELTLSQGHPATINDSALVRLVRESAVGLDLRTGREKPSPVSEDFSLLARCAPGCYFLVGAALDDQPALHQAHSATFDLHEGFLPVAAALLSECAHRYLRQSPPGS